MSDQKFERYKEKLYQEMVAMAESHKASLDDLRDYVIGQLCKDDGMTSDPGLLRLGQQAKELFDLPLQVWEETR